MSAFSKISAYVTDTAAIVVKTDVTRTGRTSVIHTGSVLRGSDNQSRTAVAGRFSCKITRTGR